MCERFGTATYLSALDALLQRNYDAMKVLLAMVFEEGRTLSFTDYICDDGVGFGPYELKLSLTRTGDKVHLDFTGSSPQAVGPINYYINENLTRMFFGIYMITVADPQILWNDGFYPLVDVTIPDGSYWKPKHPAALSGRNHGIGRVFDLFGGLLGQTNPALLNAAGFSSSPHFMYSGHYSTGDRAGEWFQLYSIGFGGIPGRPLGDGPDGHSLWPSFVNIPCEYLESYYPLRIEKWETVADTGGAGLHRGGNGVDVAYVFEEPGAIAIHDDRWLTYPWGVNGGTPGARGTKWVERADGTREVLPSQVPRRAGRRRRRAALRHLGRRRVGRPAGARPRAGRAWRCGAAWSPPTGARRYGVVRRRRRRRRRRRHGGAARRAARRPPRRAAGLRHGSADRGAARPLRGGDRAARAHPPRLGELTASGGAGRWRCRARAVVRGVAGAHGASFSGRVGWGADPPCSSSTCAAPTPSPTGPSPCPTWAPPWQADRRPRRRPRAAPASRWSGPRCGMPPTCPTAGCSCARSRRSRPSPRAPRAGGAS